MLIKSVIQAIPTYSMSCFKLPKGLIQEIETLIRKFWWGYGGDNRKIHWVRWERLCEVKEVRGMGFKEIEKSNDPILAKQVWRMMNNRDSLCYRVCKARFFPNGSILDAKESSLGSYAWKSILSAWDIIKKGAVWCIGDGQSVCIREDKWLLDEVYRKVSLPISSIPPDAKVSGLIDANIGSWRTDNALKCILVICLCGRYLLITMLNLYN